MDNREKCVELMNNCIRHMDRDNMLKVLEFMYELRDPEMKDKAMAYFLTLITPILFFNKGIRWLLEEFHINQIRDSNNKLILVY